MQQSVIVMDNCSIHHDEDIWQIIEDECGTVNLPVLPYGAELLYRCQTSLPPTVLSRFQPDRGMFFFHEGMAAKA